MSIPATSVKKYIATCPRAQRIASRGLFTGEENQLVPAQVAEEVAAHPGKVWLFIISLRREDTARLGYDKAEEWKALRSKYVMEMAEAMKIPWEDFQWYVAFHDESTIPMSTWSATAPSRRKAFSPHRASPKSSPDEQKKSSDRSSRSFTRSRHRAGTR